MGEVLACSESIGEINTKKPGFCEEKTLEGLTTAG